VVAWRQPASPPISLGLVRDPRAAPSVPLVLPATSQQRLPFPLVLPDRLDRESFETIRALLDTVDVGGRLRYIREFIWRGGTLQFVSDPHGSGGGWYALTAEWAAAVLESAVQKGAGLESAARDRAGLESAARDGAGPESAAREGAGPESAVRQGAGPESAAWPERGLVSANTPVLEGRWIRGRSGYQLQVGIDLSVPSAIQIRSSQLLSHVPFMGRSPAQVEQALQMELSAYAEAFLSHCQPVPQAAAQAARRLQLLGLAA